MYKFLNRCPRARVDSRPTSVNSPSRLYMISFPHLGDYLTQKAGWLPVIVGFITGKRCTSLLVYGFNPPLIGKVFPIGMTIEDDCFGEGSESTVWPDYSDECAYVGKEGGGGEALSLVAAMIKQISGVEIRNNQTEHSGSEWRVQDIKVLLCRICVCVHAHSQAGTPAS